MTENTSSWNIQKEYVIQAPLDEIWDCLSNSDISTFWQGQDCNIGKTVGDGISLFNGWVTGKIIEI